MRSVAILWQSVIAFCTGIAFSCVLAEHVSCAGRLKVVWYGKGKVKG